MGEPRGNEYVRRGLFTPKSVSFGYRLWNRTWVGAQRSRSGEHTPKPSTYKITEQLENGTRYKDTLSS